MWNAVSYFENLNSILIATNGIHKFCRVSGLDLLEDVLNNYSKDVAFTAVDDSDDGVTIQRGGAFFNRRAVMVYILKKYDFKSMLDREAKLNECRAIYQSLLSKVIRDSAVIDELMFLDKTRFPYHELPGMFVAGTTGIYFMLTLEEPVNLVYNSICWVQSFDKSFDKTFG